MTRHFAGKFRNLSAVAFFVALVAILITPASLAQMQAQTQTKNTGQASAESSAASASTAAITPAQVLQHSPLPGAGERQRFAIDDAQKKKSGFVSQDLVPQEQGNPLFVPGAFYASGGSGVVQVVLADVNHDGNLDMVVANEAGQANGDGSLGVLLGNGDGTFQPVVAYDSGGLYAASIAVADVNGDGKPDIIVANFCNAACSENEEGSVGVLLGNGDGTFQPVVTYGSGASDALGVAVADLNSDGKPDIVVTNCNSGELACWEGSGIVGVLLGNGDGTYQPVVTYSLSLLFDLAGADGVAIADVNQDGIPDLVVGTGDPGSGLGGVLAILLGNGDGTFRPGNVYQAGAYSPTLAPVVADVNGDGIPDLVAVNPAETVEVLLGMGGGLFSEAVSYDAGGSPGSVAVADVNGDGILDMIAWDSDSVAVLFGKGDGTFQLPVLFNPGGAGAAVADLTNDGKLDLIVSQGNYAGVLLNNRQGPPYISTTTALVSSENPAPRKQTIIYTATVTSQTGGTVTGTVTFQDGGHTIAIQTLTGNQASLSVYYKKGGSHAITAAYSGDAANNFSNSPTLLEGIGTLPFATRTKVKTSGSPSNYGQAVTFTATVSWVDGTVPDGETVAFLDGTNEIGTGTTANGIATFTTSALAVGTHMIEASYPGDPSFKASDGKIKQIVKGPGAH